jgi:hypothetical protein
MTLASAADVCDSVLTVVDEALQRCARPEVSTKMVTAGEIAWDDVCGLLAVAPEAVYRTEVFPTPAPADRPCPGAVIAVNVVVLLVRCVPTPRETGRGPAASSIQSASVELLRDAAVIWEAVTNELPEEWSAADFRQTVVGSLGGGIATETRFIVSPHYTNWCLDCDD